MWMVVCPRIFYRLLQIKAPQQASNATGAPQQASDATGAPQQASDATGAPQQASGAATSPACYRARHSNQEAN